MPQYTPGSSQSSLNALVRVLALVLLPWVAGVGVGRADAATLERHAPSPEELAAAEMLKPALSITGGAEAVAGEAAPRWLVGRKEMRLLHPVAAVARGDAVYIVDDALQGVFKYSVSQKTLQLVVDAAKHFRGKPAGVAVSDDGMIYVADPTGNAVLLFAADGRFLKKVADRNNLARPAGVAVDDQSGNVFVLDAVFTRVLVFNREGTSIYTIGERGDEPGQFVNLTAFSLGGDGKIYVANRAGHPLHVFASGGEFEYAFGDGSVINPAAVATDGHGRVYVADSEDQYIKIFLDGQLIAKFGGVGVRPEKFRDIADMDIVGNLLYVTDSGNHRIQVFEILSPGL